MALLSFDLYGDPPDAGSFPDVLHCEPIAARARLHDWSFVAHSHPALHQVFWVSKGGGLVSIDGIPQGFGLHTLLFMPALTVHGFNFTPGTSGWVISLPATDRLPVPEGPQLLKVTGTSEPTQVTGILSTIADEYGAARPARAAMLEAQALLLAVFVTRASGRRDPPPDSSRRRLMRRFTALIEARFREGLGVEGYAAALGVTPTHLSRVCREVTSRPASALIQDRMLLEARRMLAHTGERITAIAAGLGFADPAYFTRVFTQRTGRTPTVFRREAELRRGSGQAAGSVQT